MLLGINLHFLLNQHDDSMKTKFENFIEKQLRTILFLISICVLVVFTYSFVVGFYGLSTAKLIVLAFFVLFTLVCTLAQMRLYKIQGYRYFLFSLPSLGFAVLFIFLQKIS